MDINQANPKQAKKNQKISRRPSLCLLVHNLSFDLRRGVEEVARQQNANLICFPGGIVHDPLGFNSQANILYDLIDLKRFDSLIVWLSAINGYMSLQDVKNFCSHFKPLPMIGIGRHQEDFITFDLPPYQDMCDEILHLIDHHHYHHIAFIRGAEGHAGAADRYQAYQDTMLKAGIGLDPNLVTPPYDDWETPERGAKAVDLFFDERKLRPHVDIDVIVAANDVVAISALGALHDKGIRVPEDVALVGFDDIAQSSFVSPPLTTVRRDYYKEGRRSAEWAIASLKSEPIVAQPEEENNLIIRRSCGCPDPTITFAYTQPDEPNGDSFDENWSVHQVEIVSAMFQEVGSSVACPDQECIEQLLNSFYSDLKGARYKGFIPTLGMILDRVMTARGRLSVWQNAISILRSWVLPWIVDQKIRNEVENLCGQARVMIGGMAQRAEGYRRSLADRQYQLLNEIQTTMATMLDVKGIMNVLAESLPRLGIPSCYISLYEDPTPYRYSQPVPEFSHLVLAYNENGRCPLDLYGFRFPSRQLIPDGLWPTDRFYSLIVEPLYFRSDQLGFAVFEVGPREQTVYEMLQVNISSALRSNQLYQEAAEGRRLAEDANHLKSRFLSTVSHELRTPLNVIVGLSELLLREQSQLDRSEFEDLQRIYTSAQHLGYLIRDVLDLASSDAGQLRLTCESLDLVETLKVVVITGEQLAREQGLEWVLKMPDHLPAVWGDRTRLRQVALNFISNAVKFTPKGSIIFNVEADSKQVTVSITDSGIGIPIEDQEIIFNEFKQSKRTTAYGYAGLGLGLSISKHLIDLHGGKIGARSSGVEGEGSTFYFSLPVLAVNSKPAEVFPLSYKQPTLLLTVDTETGAQVKDYLARQEFDVVQRVVFPDQDWLSIVVETSPNALLIDRRLICEQTWDIVRKLKEHPVHQNIPVVFFGWYPDKHEGSVLEFDYRFKPLNIDQLEMMLSKPITDRHDTTILLVDDDPDILNVHTRLIHQQMPGCHVLQARNGREALETIKHKRPDLILLDLMMPELDGFGVLDALRGQESTRDIPVTVLTGQSLTESDLARLNQGVTAVLEKGLFSEQEMLEHLSQSLLRVNRSRNTARQIVSLAMAYIHENYEDPLSRELIAGHVSVHVNYLTNCFTQVLGISPIIYLNRYRINQARKLLEAGELNITQIAMAVGFSDPAYFSRMFQREIGIAPGVYRRGQRP